MSLIINAQNVEDLVFYDKSLQKQLPDLENIFSQWATGKRVPAIGFLAQKAKQQLFDALAPSHIAVMESYFNQNVTIERIDNSISQSYVMPVVELQDWLPNRSFGNNFCLGRDQDNVYISFWR